VERLVERLVERFLEESFWETLRERLATVNFLAARLAERERERFWLLTILLTCLTILL
jgi:hypothetical protein